MGSVVVVGVGYCEDQLTLKAAELLKSGADIILHTERCGVADYLRKNSIAYTSLDGLYDVHEDFDEHAEAAANAVNKAAEINDVVYCVMDVRDLSARILAENGARIVPGPAAEGALMAWTSQPTQYYAAADWEEIYPDADMNTVVREIDSRELACEVKLRLMETYPDETECMVMSSQGICRTELHMLDRMSGYDHRFCVLVKAEKDVYSLNSLPMRKLVETARTCDAVYAECPPEEIAAILAKAAGAIAYAEDRGEFTLADMMIDARDELDV